MIQRDLGTWITFILTATLLQLTLARAQESPTADLATADPLPSWRASSTRQAIIDFVARVTDPRHQDYVPPAERIAVFDNDGTLWSEQPMYGQLAFVLDRVKQLSADHPEWKDTQPYKAALESDLKTLASGGEEMLLELVMATHAGTTTDEFESLVTQWLATTKHPRYNRLYTECIYQPMLELLEYLRSHEFKTYIVSGGGVEFMRPWTAQVYGIPPEQVIGSTIKVEYTLRDGRPALVRLPQIDMIDDKAGKPVGIHKFIGRRPILAFGNSDGDFQMLEYTTGGAGPALGLLLHHTDDQREVAYDRRSAFGRLNRGLDEAAERGWVIVDMKDDWLQVFPK